MDKSSFWGLLAAATLLGACSGEIGSLGSDARFGADQDMVAELSASNGWRSIEASEPAFDTLRFDVMARPEVANIDALVAVGADGITDFSDASIKVRFADDGFIDATDGSTFRSDNAFRYEPGVWYKITISANVVDRTYDVAVAGRGGRAETLITDAAFDSEASTTDHLATWAAWSSQSARLDIARHTWVASGSCAPSTCLSLDVVCGEPSDGCGGSLTCGSCASGQTCESGECVDVPPSPNPPPPPTCMPETCMALGVECGSWNDGCGGTLTCGGCPSGQTCADGLCVDDQPPSPPPCIPATCTSWGAECGIWSDGCGGLLSCGGCGSGRSCTSGVCVDDEPPPPAPCQPATCLALGKECGNWSDGCGGTLNCGGCTGSELCSAAGACYEPVGPGPEGEILWASTEQTQGVPCNFSSACCEYAGNGEGCGICSDANGTNVSRVTLASEGLPAHGGDVYAIRQYVGNDDYDFYRSEIGAWTGGSPELLAHMRTGASTYFIMDMYIPEPIDWGGNFLSLWDFHNSNGGAFIGDHTCPGIMLVNGSSMRLRSVYACDGDYENHGSTSYTLPYGEWFTLEIEYRYSSSNGGVSVWINGNLVLTDSGRNTRPNPSGNTPQFYSKVYGAGQVPAVSSAPFVVYRKNYRASDSPFH